MKIELDTTYRKIWQNDQGEYVPMQTLLEIGEAFDDVRGALEGYVYRKPGQDWIGEGTEAFATLSSAIHASGVSLRDARPYDANGEPFKN